MQVSRVEKESAMFNTQLVLNNKTVTIIVKKEDKDQDRDDLCKETSS
jgi:hypothetical protein